ncbi:MAG: hypothetical protein CMN31_22660 [Sandaracinus sp.]|nr:hypothetical protein [Sandaracinus sp.]
MSGGPSRGLAPGPRPRLGVQEMRLADPLTIHPLEPAMGLAAAIASLLSCIGWMTILAHAALVWLFLGLPVGIVSLVLLIGKPAKKEQPQLRIFRIAVALTMLHAASGAVALAACLFGGV